MTEPSSDFRRRFPSAPSSARGAREFVSGVLRGAQLDKAAIGEFELIVSELVANAVEHGDGGDVSVHVGVADAAWLNLTIRSGISRRMPPLDPASWRVAAASQPSGRGLGIVRELAHEIDVVRDGDCLEITCRRRR